MMLKNREHESIDSPSLNQQGPKHGVLIMALIAHTYSQDAHRIVCCLFLAHKAAVLEECDLAKFVFIGWLPPDSLAAKPSFTAIYSIYFSFTKLRCAQVRNKGKSLC